MIDKKHKLLSVRAHPYGLILIDLDQRITLEKFKVANGSRIANAA